MKYLQNLTDHLIDSGIHQEQLESWAEEGQILSSPSSIDDGYAVAYTCIFELSCIEMTPDRLLMHLVNWIGIYNPHRDGQQVRKPEFAIERLSNNKFDIGIRIDFIEQFNFKADPEGQWDVGGVKMSLVSEFDELLDIKNTGELLVFDSHTQDTGLKN